MVSSSAHFIKMFQQILKKLFEEKTILSHIQQILDYGRLAASPLTLNHLILASS